MTSDADSDTSPPPEVREAAKETTLNLLPKQSKEKYVSAYTTFMEWCNNEKVNSLSENVPLAYFSELSNKYKALSLWTFYSMLRCTLNINNEINLESFAKLRTFLKRKSEYHVPKKAKNFTPEQIKKFITEAPDEKYLATKVALIMGIMGACGATELHSMQITDIQDFGSTLVVIIPNTKTKISRRFKITGNFYSVCKKYLNLRPSSIVQPSIFYKFQIGKYFLTRIGINKFGSMGKEIATFLKFPNICLYTGHCFRRSSATLLVDAGGDITALKRHGGWRSPAVAEEYFDQFHKK